jgi:hypothetical protein
MMKLLSKFEASVRGVIEGLSVRVFRTRLEPVELAKKLEQTLEVEARVMPDGALAPNLYDVSLSRKDYDQYNPFRQSLCQQMQEHLTNVARTRGYRLNSRPVVELRLDARLVTGQVRIEASFVDPQHVPADPHLARDLANAGLQQTQMLSGAGAPAGAPVAPPGLPQARLTLYQGQSPVRMYPINREIMNIGRHFSNDVVIQEPQLSRYHARIEYQNGTFVIYDLASTNGVRVNGIRTSQQVLHSGDRIRIGSVELLFERR